MSNPNLDRIIHVGKLLKQHTTFLREEMKDFKFNTGYLNFVSHGNTLSCLIREWGQQWGNKAENESIYFNSLLPIVKAWHDLVVECLLDIQLIEEPE